MIVVEKYAKQSVDRLYVSDRIIEILKNNNIDTLGKLENKKISDLLEIGLNTDDINKIGNELKLIGI